MGKTLNRMPLSVATPSSSDVKDYFFTHGNWKGLSNNKNFLTVDQETFSECENVYTNSEGLLRSRPALKVKSIVNGQTVLSDVSNVWEFGNVIVYEFYNSGSRYLLFVNEESDKSFQEEITSDFKLVLVEGKIFVFFEDALRYYDISENTYNQADDFIYVPVTELYENDVPYNKGEPYNELTSSKVTRYSYTLNSVFRTNSMFYGKTLPVTLDSEKYQDVLFNELTPNIVVGKTSRIHSANYNTGNRLGLGMEGYPLISSSAYKPYTIISYEFLEYDNSVKIKYTLDGRTFVEIPRAEKVIGKPFVTDDGTHVIVFKEDGPYAYCVINDATFNFDGWLNLFEYFGIKLENFSINTEKPTVSAHFKSLNDFIFTYTSNYSAMDKVSENIYVVAMQGTDISHYGIINVPTLSSSSYTSVIKLSSQDVTPEGDYVYKYPDTLLHFKYDVQDKTYEYAPYVKLSNFTFFYITGASAHRAECTIEVFNGLSKSIYVNANIYESDDYIWESEFFTFQMLQVGTEGFDPKFDIKFTLKSVNFSQYKGTLSNYVPQVKFDSSLAYVELVRYLDSKYYSLGIITDVKNCNTKVYSYEYVQSVIAPLRHGMYFKDGIHKDVTYKSIDGLGTGEIISTHSYNKETLERLSSANVQLSQGEYIPNALHRISFDGNIVLSEEYIWRISESNSVVSKSKLLFKSLPIFCNDYDIVVVDELRKEDRFLYITGEYSVLIVDILQEGETKYFLPSHVAELSSYYMSVGKTLYISKYPDDGNFKWYFPKNSTEKIDYEITNLHPISSTDVAIFTNNNLYYVKSDSGLHYYYKSKIQTGCKQGAEVITSYDGKYIIFPTVRGLVAMTYQQLVASDEQTLTYLSDNIIDTFKFLYSLGAIKLYEYDFWIVCYVKDSNYMLLFDTRNNSWWPLKMHDDVSKLFILNEDLHFIIKGNLYNLSKSDSDYFDFDGSNKFNIDWYFKSQKLHLDAINYYKHITNITLTSVLDELKEMHMDLRVYNYRKRLHTSDVEAFKFDIDSVRVYVKRLNYSKVNEFQYLLTSDFLDEDLDDEIKNSIIKTPLSLSSITVKYKITGQVR